MGTSKHTAISLSLSLSYSTLTHISYSVYDSLAPRNLLGAVCVGVPIAYFASAVADVTHAATRLLAGLPTLTRQGIAATRKARFIRSIPGGLALALYDHALQIYCGRKSVIN